MVVGVKVPDLASMPPRSRQLSTIAAVGLVVLGTSACGRRGGLEPPSDDGLGRPVRSVAGLGPQGPASPRSLPRSIGLGGGASGADPVAVRDGDELAPSAVPPSSGTEAPVQTSRGAKRGYTIPKQPFFLDPLL